jgi:hypothetical protein
VSVRMVIADTDVAWDGAVQHVPAGTLVAIEPGSVLEAAYGGASNLVDLGDGAEAVAQQAGASN